MNERVKRMKESLRISKYPLCVELFRLANESLEKTGGEPQLLRRAKLHANILDNITIFIEPDDLLCGSGASKPFGLEMATFEEVKAAIFEEIRHLMRMANERINVEMIAERELFPDVFRSALMKDGGKEGKDMFTRRFKFENGAVLGAVGAVNAGNGLYAIKKLIFEEKKYTMAQLMEALDADWVGYEAMQEDFKSQAKYGNNNAEVDEMVAEFYKLHADVCLSLPCVYGATQKVKVPGFAPRQRAVTVEYEPSPELGGSNKEIYGDLLGYTEEQMAEMKKNRTI